MLDQNTDRMWYVIGAVIVGAAIILIMNGTMPQIFASVAGTFSDKTEEVTGSVDKLTLTDGVLPKGVNENLIPNSDDLELWGHKAAPIESYNDGWSRFALPTIAHEFGSNTIIDVLPNTEYTETIYIRTDADALINPTISLFWAGEGHVLVDTTVTEVEPDLWKVVGTGYTEEGHTRMRVPDIHVRFNGGTYAEFGQFKLEKGAVSTPWVK